MPVPTPTSVASQTSSVTSVAQSSPVLVETVPLSVPVDKQHVQDIPGPWPSMEAAGLNGKDYVGDLGNIEDADFAEMASFELKAIPRPHENKIATMKVTVPTTRS